MQRSSVSLGHSMRRAGVLAIAAMTLLLPGSLAQTPEGGEPATEAPHPAHIHAGSCAELGEVVLPLSDVAAPAGEHSGPESALPVKTGQTTVDMPLQEIIDGGHAINVHLSADEIGTYIACGDIGGTVITDANGRMELMIGLGELNDSGHHGIAWLGADGEQTDVSVHLAGSASGN